MHELARASVHKDQAQKNQLLEVIKEHFKKGSELLKELRIFQEVHNAFGFNHGNNDNTAAGMDELSAEKFIQEIKKAYNQLDQKEIFEKQSLLVKGMKNINPDIFSTFVASYKDLASINQIFSKDISIKSRILLENQIINKLSQTQQPGQQLAPADQLVLRSFINKFNEQYKGLLEEQKQLISKFVTSFIDNGLTLKIYLNEEIGRLKQAIKASIKESKEIKEDSIMQENIKKVLLILENCANKDIDEQMISDVVKVQGLCKEIQNA